MTPPQQRHIGFVVLDNAKRLKLQDGIGEVVPVAYINAIEFHVERDIDEVKICDVRPCYREQPA
jgi:hypothetical protein